MLAPACPTPCVLKVETQAQWSLMSTGMPFSPERDLTNFGQIEIVEPIEHSFINVCRDHIGHDAIVVEPATDSPFASCIMAVGLFLRSETLTTTGFNALHVDLQNTHVDTVYNSVFILSSRGSMSLDQIGRRPSSFNVSRTMAVLTFWTDSCGNRISLTKADSARRSGVTTLMK